MQPQSPLRIWRPQWRFRSYLVVWAGACILLLVALSTFVVVQFAGMQQDISRHEILGTARATALVVDQQLAGGVSDLRALAALRASQDDLGRFYEECKAVANAVKGWVRLARASGETILDTRLPMGAAAERAGASGDFDQAVASKQLLVSNLYYGGSDRAPQFSIHLPIVEQDEVRYVLSLSFPTTVLADLLVAQHLPDNWTVGISDRNRTIMARHYRSEAFVGRRLPAKAPQVPPGKTEAFFPVVDSGGVPIYLASVLSALAGWEVVIGIPQAEADAPLRTSLDRILGVGAVVLLLAIATAWAFGHRLSRAMALLSEAALSLVDLKPVAAFGSTIREIGDVASALETAGERLRDNDNRLRRAQEHLARAQQVAAVGSYEHDFGTGGSVWSAETYAIFGQSPQTYAPTGANFVACVHEEDRALARELIAAIRSGRESPGVDIRIVRPDRSIRVIHVECELVRNAEGVITGYLGTCHDVTERLRLERGRHELEAQLHHSQKLEALGTLAGGIAHDINNTLVPVVSLAKRVRDKLPVGGQDRMSLDLVVGAGARIRDLVGRILAFSRKESAAWAAVDLARVIREALQMLRATIATTIDIEVNVDRAAPMWGDASQLYQVITNLVTNSAQAIGDAPGRITISLEERSGAKDEARVLSLSVSDTGAGMDEATCDRIFEPFFTTKGVGEGTGLGLSVVHGIVTAHKGTIGVRSEVGRGTCVEIAFPRAGAASEPSEAPVRALA
jgi:PAS domain S-box-containing protein